jgi:hypothetical protein
VYAPWVCYMGIWALYKPKLPKWPLIGMPDLAGDRVCGALHKHMVRVSFKLRFLNAPL